jgi:hypothetical protein
MAPPEIRTEQRRGGKSRIGSLLRWIYEPVFAHRRAFTTLALVYFGALFVGMGLAAIDPSLQRALVEAVGATFTAGPLSAVGSAYLNAELLQAIGLTFVVNLVVGSFLYITVPSLLFGLGLMVGVLRAVLWGVLFAPFGGLFDLTILPHVLTIMVEGLAYVIAMLGVWLWWRPVFTRAGERGRAFVAGLKLQARIYVAVAFTLLVAAIYEALEIILLIPLL